MAIKYRPLTDEELDTLVEERITAAIEALNEISDLVLPQELLNALEDTVSSFNWEDRVRQDDYDLYETYLDDYRMQG